MNPNDEIHFKDLANNLSKFPREQLSNQLRGMQLIIGKGLLEAKKEQLAHLLVFMMTIFAMLFKLILKIKMMRKY